MQLSVCFCVALNRAKSLLDRAVAQSNRTTMYFERLTELRLLLLDLDNHTRQSTRHSEDAAGHNTRNRRILRTVLVHSSLLHYHHLFSLSVLQLVSCCERLI